VTRWAIVDTGPLVAHLDRRERHHAWTAAQIKRLEQPLLVCEAVITEAMYLLARHPLAQDGILGMLESGALEIGFQLAEHHKEVRELCRKYRDRPMSLADACILRMAELHEQHAVFTLDGDFRIYRKHGDEPLTVIAPA